MLKVQQASKSDRQNPWKKRLPTAVTDSTPIISGGSPGTLTWWSLSQYIQEYQLPTYTKLIIFPRLLPSATLTSMLLHWFDQAGRAMAQYSQVYALCIA